MTAEPFNADLSDAEYWRRMFRQWWRVRHDPRLSAPGYLEMSVDALRRLRIRTDLLHGPDAGGLDDRKQPVQRELRL